MSIFIRISIGYNCFIYVFKIFFFCIWELLDYASSPNHDVVVGYWRSGIDDDVIVGLRKHNIIQNRGTAGAVEAMVSDLQQGVTELECCFPYPREVLMKYIEEGN